MVLCVSFKNIASKSSIEVETEGGYDLDPPFPDSFCILS